MAIISLDYEIISDLYIKPVDPVTFVTIRIRMPAKIKFSVLEKSITNGLGRNDCWAVKVSGEVRVWLSQEYRYGIDYEEVNSLKGVWVNVTEPVLVMLKLKWS